MLYAEIAADAFPALAGEEAARRAALPSSKRWRRCRPGSACSSSLRDVGIGREHLPKLAADAMKQTRLLVNNPRAWRSRCAGNLRGGVVKARLATRLRWLKGPAHPTLRLQGIPRADDALDGQ